MKQRKFKLQDDLTYRGYAKTLKKTPKIKSHGDTKIKQLPDLDKIIKRLESNKYSRTRNK